MKGSKKKKIEQAEENDEESGSVLGQPKETKQVYFINLCSIYVKL